MKGAGKVVRAANTKRAIALTLCIFVPILIAVIGGRAVWHALSLESSFDLAPDSRLPSWFTMPRQLSRSDVSVTMDYYTGPSDRTATFTLRNARNGEKVAKVDGTLKGLEPLNLQNRKGPPYDVYPSYEIITVEKTTEVIEHRKMEPVFYVTDDPAVISRLGVTR